MNEGTASDFQPATMMLPSAGVIMRPSNSRTPTISQHQNHSGSSSSGPESFESQSASSGRESSGSSSMSRLDTLFQTPSANALNGNPTSPPAHELRTLAPKPPPKLGILQQVLQRTPYRPIQPKPSVPVFGNPTGFGPSPGYRTPKPFNAERQQRAENRPFPDNFSRPVSATLNSNFQRPSRPIRFAPPIFPDAQKFQNHSDASASSRNHILAMRKSNENRRASGSGLSGISGDGLAGVSELTEISRASIPMAPLDDDSGCNGELPEVLSPGDIMVPHSPAGRSEGAESDGARYRIEIVESVDDMDIVPADPRLALVSDANFGFETFHEALDFLSLQEEPLNPFNLESDKELLASVFGPVMTIYRCGGCSSMFLFRKFFIDHFYGAVIPFFLECGPCGEKLSFGNVCQIKQHVKTHKNTSQNGNEFRLTVGIDSEEMRAKLLEGIDSDDSRTVKINGAQKPPVVSENNNSLLISQLAERPKETSKLGQMLANRSAPLFPPKAASPPKPPAQSFPKVSQPPPVGRHGPTISVNQILEKEMAAKAMKNGGGFGIPCAFCNTRFENQNGITNHFQRCKDVAKAAQDLRCPKCQMVCSNACSFEAHRKLHEIRNNPSMIDICCPECGLRLKSREEVDLHVGRRCVHFSRTLWSSYSCCVINCRFHVSDEAEYLNHVAVGHGGPDQNRGVCPVCKATVTGPRSDLARHLLGNPPCRIRIMQQKSQFFAYRCNYCPPENAPLCETKAAMREHIASEHSEDPLQMNLIQNGGAVASGKDVSFEGMASSHGEMYCRMCEDNFVIDAPLNDLEALEAHIYKCHIPRSYPTVCRHCDLSFSSAQELFGHLVCSVFKMPNLLQCDRCHFVTLAPDGVAEHSHVFHQPNMQFTFPCTMCMKVGYSSAEQLKNHLAVAHGVQQDQSRKTELETLLNSNSRNPNPRGPQLLMNKLPLKRPSMDDQPVPMKLPRSNSASSANFACRLCDFESSSPLGFAEHVQKQHGMELNRITELRKPSPNSIPAEPQKASANTNQFPCRLCDFETNSRNVFAEHVKAVHGFDLDLKTTGSAESGRTSKPPGSAKYCCKVCEDQKSSFICDSPHIFHEHIRQAHPAKESSYQCCECALQLLSPSALQRHLHVVHGVSNPSVYLATSPFYNRQKPATKGPQSVVEGSSFLKQPMLSLPRV